MTGLEAPAAAATTPAPPTPEETTAAVLPAGETTPTEQPSDGAALETPEVEQEPNLEETPETSGDFAKYKPLFKDNPELRNIIGREQAFSSLGSFSEVREIVQRIPTVADAEQLVADSENRREMGRTFREDVPTFVESLKNADPLAFQQFANELPKVLAEADPAMYSSQARTYSNAVLTNLAQIAHQEGNQDLLTAIHVVAQKLGARLGAEPTPQRDNSEAARLRKQLDERNQADNQAALTVFNKSVDDAVGEDMLSQIDKTIKDKFPSATEKQHVAMVREAYERSMDMLRAQPQTMAQVNQFRDNAARGKRGDQEKRSAIQCITGRTRLIVPKSIKVTFDEWSPSIIAVNKKIIDEKTALAAKTRDVGTGPGATTSAAAPTNAGQGKRHAKDIYTEIEQGRYVKR